MQQPSQWKTSIIIDPFSADIPKYLIILGLCCQKKFLAGKFDVGGQMRQIRWEIAQMNLVPGW